jgi:HEAT repeat protein
VLAAALKDENASIVQAAAGALGRIGNTPAGKALLAAMEAPSDAARAAIGEGALAAAARLTAKGKGHESLALCERLLDTAWPEQVRYGAFREVIVAEDVAKGLARLVAALGGEDAKLRDYAAFLIATSPKMGATRALAKTLPGLPATGQAALLSGLAGRKDAAAREATLAALESGDVAVKAAAVRALGAYGAASDVAKVAALLSAEGAPCRTPRRTR